MRTISVDGLKQLFAQEASDVFLVVITISHPELTTPLRYVNDIKDLTYNGYTYTALPFKFTLPPDTKDKPPSAKIVLDNINRDTINLFRSITDAPTLTIEIVRVSPDRTVTSEIGPYELRMNDITYTASTLEATLGYETDVLNESAVADYFSPHLFPGLF